MLCVCHTPRTVSCVRPRACSKTRRICKGMLFFYLEWRSKRSSALSAAEGAETFFVSSPQGRTYTEAASTSVSPRDRSAALAAHAWRSARSCERPAAGDARAKVSHRSLREGFPQVPSLRPARAKASHRSLRSGLPRVRSFAQPRCRARVWHPTQLSKKTVLGTPCGQQAPNTIKQKTIYEKPVFGTPCGQQAPNTIKQYFFYEKPVFGTPCGQQAPNTIKQKTIYEKPVFGTPCGQQAPLHRGNAR